MLDEPVLTRARRLVGPAPRARRARRRKSCSRRSRPRTCAAAAAPASRPGQVGVHARAAGAREKFIVANGDEGDPGSYIDKVPDGAQPDAAARGHGARRLRGRRRARLRPRPLGVPAARSRRSTAAIASAHAPACSATDILGSGFSLRRHDRRGRRLLRRRRGDGAARVPAGAARHGLGAPAVPGRARRPRRCRRSSTTSRRSATSPFIALHGAEAYRALSPGATPGSQARLLQRALRATRASTRCRSG